VFESLIKIFKPLKYEVFNAVDHVSFEVAAGECIGVIGKNGSGKSTLLKLLAGIIRPDSGSIKIDGEIVPFLELGLGFSGELTGRENIYLNGMLLGLSKKEIDEKFQGIVRFSELGNFIDTKLKNYSSGMHLRLAFSVAIYAQGDIYLVDEVIAVGDAEFRKKCIDVFRYFKDKGKTIIFVSHSMDTIREICDKTFLLEHGKMRYFGDSESVIGKYLQS
jgi:lipopolysaccharide transport system ATP-binding protein